MTETNQPTKTRRKLKTSWKVALSDKIARQVITIGGIATIGSVMLVVLVLVSNVLPLLRKSSIDPTATVVPLQRDGQDGTAELASQLESAASVPIIHSGIDEFGEIVWFMNSQGDLVCRSVHNQQLLAVFSNSTKPTAELTASLRDRSGDRLMLGRSDGTLQQFSIKYETTFLKHDELPDDVAEALSPQNGVVSEVVSNGDSTYRILAGQLIRRQRVSDVAASEPQSVSDSPIRSIDSLPPKLLSSFDQSTEAVFAAVTDTEFVAGTIDTKRNQFTGEESVSWEHTSCPLPTDLISDDCAGILVHQRGDSATVWLENGAAHRFKISSDAPPNWLSAVESLWPEQDSQMTIRTAVPLLGDNTMLLGTSSGTVVGTFLAQQENAQDSLRTDKFVPAHRFDFADSPVVKLGASSGSRLFVSLQENNQLQVSYVPTTTVLDQQQVDVSGNATEVWISPKQDKIGVLAGNNLQLYNLALGYPEASLKSFFSPIWYEGYSEPVSIWQSSSAGVDAEPKLSMLPLIFGTLKATFYSLLIAVPLALMAAIYSSEFLSRPVRNRVKPVIELMAGIPSVVLGFIAALVLASLFRENVFAILLSFFTLIFCLGLVGNLWLLLPQQIYLRLERFRTTVMVFVVPLGIYAAWAIAPPLERLLFERSLIWWLDAQDASAWPGWFMLLLPLAMLFVSYLSVTIVAGLLRPIARDWGAKPFSILMVARYLLSCLATVGLAALLATVLTSSGFDPRGTFFGSYQERNALLVGSVLGFAIIPIIYTIAEDALQAVPQHLRSASLGCGATAWQTTTRIVLPTAMSGLFGGIMIGFGRAVGETMVVLMAAGNTPVMDVNPFNGYRTLSATLATELPEAAHESAHFHTLFLAALLLFCFTLVANTLAEFVRMRFRKRSYQL